MISVSVISDDQHPFDQIIQIAKTSADYSHAAKALKDLLTHDIDIDIVHEVERITPAASLAREGNQAAVELLLQFGANIVFCAQQAILHGHTELANMLCNDYGAIKEFVTPKFTPPVTEDIAEQAKLAARIRAHEFILKNRLNHTSFLNDIAYHAALAGDFMFATRLFLENGAYLKAVAEGALCGGFFANEKLALHTLVFITNERFRCELVEELAELNLSYSINQVLARALLIIQLQPDYTFRQCMTLTNAELQALDIRHPVLQAVETYRSARRWLYWFSSTPTADAFQQKLAAAPNTAAATQILQEAPLLDEEFNHIVQQFKPRQTL